jgi:hypothetical protein
LPTYSWLTRFGAEFKALPAAQQAAFLAAVLKLVEDLRHGRGFRKGLRVKGVRGREGIFEMTWADDGRATFRYGASIVGTEPHIIWRRIGTHAILRQP